MKKYIFKVFLFISPFIVFILAAEICITSTPNAFNQKVHYLKNNKDIEFLILGSSHTSDAVNPADLHIKSANMASAGQDYQLDSALFFKYIPQLTHLKYVLLEVDYHSLEYKNAKDDYRLPWYYYYHGINMADFNFPDRICLYKSSPAFFNTYFLNMLNPFGYKYNCNDWGFITNDFPGVFEDLKYNEDLIAGTAGNRLKARHTEISVNNFNFNKHKLLSIIDYCLKNDIEIILLKVPVFSTYRNNYITEKLGRRDAFIDSLEHQKSIILMDFEKDQRFTVKDFRNDDHLNSNGANKLTEIINQDFLILTQTGKVKNKHLKLAGQNPGR